MGLYVAGYKYHSDDNLNFEQAAISANEGTLWESFVRKADQAQASQAPFPFTTYKRQANERSLSSNAYYQSSKVSHGLVNLAWNTLSWLDEW